MSDSSLEEMGVFIEDEDMDIKTVVYVTGEIDESSCGYCKSSALRENTSDTDKWKDANHSESDASLSSDDGNENRKTAKSVMMYVLHGQKLRALDYQLLINNGWRRSGRYLYRNLLDRTCCPTHTIRLDATKFSATKSQKKTIRKMSNWIKSGCKDGQIDLMHLGGATSEKMDHNLNLNGDILNCYDGSFFIEERRNLINQLNLIKKETVEDCIDRKDSFIFGKERKWDEVIHMTEYNKDKMFKVTLEPAFYEDETFNLYCKYQIKVHNDNPKKLIKSSYIRFLVDSPIPLQKSRHSNVVYGLFHQKYYVKDRLIAVSVLDILPQCVSGVYFIYDPDFAFLSLGTYSAMREIALTLEFFKKDPNIKYYYMGFYIHSCQKMRYKAKYQPSELKCPQSEDRWISVAKATRYLDKSKYAELPEKDYELDLSSEIKLFKEVESHNESNAADLPHLSIYLKEKEHKNSEEALDKLLNVTAFIPKQVKNGLVFYI